MGSSSTSSTVFSLICTSLILAAVGISCLDKLNYQSTHQGVLIDTWSVYGSRNTFYVMEKFQYGDQNKSCLIKRRTGRAKKQSHHFAKKKKIGTSRKIWLYKDGHCTDSSLRQYFLRSGIGYLAPLGLAIFCLFGFFCFYILQEFTSPFTLSPDRNVERSAVSSTEIEIEMGEEKV
jgi:hypothetical protein